MEVSRRLAVLFLLAVGSLLATFGAVLGRAVGIWAVAVYAVVLIVALVVLIQLAKDRVRAARRAAGRTCTCCTTSVHDPVKVI